MSVHSKVTESPLNMIKEKYFYHPFIHKTKKCFGRQEQSPGCAVKCKSPRRRERDGYGVAGVMRTLERAQSALRHDRAANLLLAGVAIASDSALDFFGSELRDEQFFFRHGGQQHSARVTHDDGGLRVLDMAEQRFNSGVIRLDISQNL